MSDLTIVVMTRDRVDLLKKALRSVFEHPFKRPPVVVSDNSTREYPEMEDLQQQYGFSSIRQSGRLTVTEHHNACLRLAKTRWVWLSTMTTSCALTHSQGSRDVSKIATMSASWLGASPTLMLKGT